MWQRSRRASVCGWVTLSGAAYERLHAERRDGESLSDVVLPLAVSAEIERLAGELDPAYAEAVEASSAEARESLEMESE